MTTIGIDNGSTGSIGIISEAGALFEDTPVMESLHYGKAGTITHRLDWQAFHRLLSGHRAKDTRILIERPLTAGPMMIKAMLSAHRCFEATIVALEALSLGYEVIDSQKWQKPLLGDVKGSKELKRASLLRGQQLYPHLAASIKHHGDADGLLIAHWAHFQTRP